MSVHEMRKAICTIYTGKTWYNKMKYMPDYQVYAIYKRLQEAKKLK